MQWTYKWRTSWNIQRIPQKIKHIGKQGYGPKANEHVSAFLFGMLPIQTQQEPSTAGKVDASTGEIKEFSRHRFHYQHIISINPIPPSTKSLRAQISQTEGNRKLHNRTVDALQKSQERVSTVIKRDTNMRSAEPRNARMRHNLNKTDKTLNPKDQSTTKSWYATIADALGTLHETVDTKRKQPPHTETYHMTNKTQKKTVDSARTSNGLINVSTQPSQYMKRKKQTSPQPMNQTKLIL